MAFRVKAHPQDHNQQIDPRTMIHFTEIMPLRKISSKTILNSEVRTALTAILNNLRTSTRSTRTFIEQNKNKNNHNVDKILTKALGVHKQKINMNMDHLINRSIIRIEGRT